MTFVIHFHDDRILAVLQQFRHVEVERCETADVMSRFPSVHIHVGIVVDSAKVEQSATIVRGMIVE